MVVIRQARPEDYDSVIVKIDGWWGGRRMAAMLPRLFFQHFGPWTLAAEEDGALVGFLAGLRSETRPHLMYCHFVGVDPELRGKGVGEALYQRLFVDAQAAGCTEVLAVTSPRNQPSIAFHRRLGFEVLPGDRFDADVPYTRDYDGPGEDRVRFRLALPALAQPRYASGD